MIHYCDKNGGIEKTRAEKIAAKKAHTAGDGVLVVNKPEAETSADVVNRIKRLPGVYKAGHAGTLDPFASGVLICPVNRATRLSRFFLQGDKKYKAVARLGIETDTLDHTGLITAEHIVPEISKEIIRRVLEKFTGRIQQVPPAYSALKYNGIPLYKYARTGKPMQKPARTVEIHDIRLNRVEPYELALEVDCSSGTYIRSLCEDIGKALECGAHARKLVRTESCGFTLGEASELTSLEAAKTPGELRNFLIPMADALHAMESYTANAALAEKIKFGRPVSETDLGRHPEAREDEAGALIKIVDIENRLLAVVEKNENECGYSYCCVFQSN